MPAVISPALVLSLLLGSLLGLAFYYLFAGKPDRLSWDWGIGVAAFVAGQILASYRPIFPLSIGEVHVVEATAMSLLALTAVKLARVRRPR